MYVCVDAGSLQTAISYQFTACYVTVHCRFSSCNWNGSGDNECCQWIPHLSLRFITERTRTINITAVGGNATLLRTWKRSSLTFSKIGSKHFWFFFQLWFSPSLDLTHSALEPEYNSMRARYGGALHWIRHGRLSTKWGTIKWWKQFCNNDDVVNVSNYDVAIGVVLHLNI